jgi:hypothetical protein
VTRTFHDVGLPSTAGMEDVAPIAKRVLRSIPHETDEKLDLIVVEMGDGIIGRYGVESILMDQEFQGWIVAHVLAANDLVAAWGGVRWLRERNIRVDVVVGPATDNQVGESYVREELGVESGNARTAADAFVDAVEKAAFGKVTAPV